MFWRILILVVVLANPIAFALYFCLSNLIASGDLRFLSSLLAEVISAVVWLYATVEALKWLRAHRYTYPVIGIELFVNLMSLVYLFFILVNLTNPETSGLLAKDGRLQFYFSNDWYRRLVTFTTIPMFLATYHAVYGVMSKAHRRWRLGNFANLGLLMLSSLSGGSKGAALLIIATACAFVFPMQGLRLFRIGLAVAIAGVGYVVTFLAFAADKTITLLSMVQRFYLSIDMSILLKSREFSELIASKLNDVWLEVFRILAAFDVRVTERPIGSLIYYYRYGTKPATGANLRYGSLLLLYPDRIDFLIGFPILVCLLGWLLYQIMVALGMRWSGRIAVPLFIASAFQDTYWFASHVTPILVATMLLVALGPIANASVRNHSNVVEGRNRSSARAPGI